jgi:hypothetical protein
LDTCFSAHSSGLRDFRHRHAFAQHPRVDGGRAAAPVLRPVYGDADAPLWLGDDDLIVGYESGDEAFDYRENQDVFVDRETGTSWDSTGRAESGPLAGERLERVGTRRAFWFSVAISFPGVEVFTPDSG